MKTIIFGKNGQIGSELQKLLQSRENNFFFTSKDCDITSKKDLDHIFKTIKPDVVINAAAYTDVDKAESNEKQAELVNHLAVKYIARECKKIGAYLIHLSTDYVFDGTMSSAYSEEDVANPLGVYGLTKLRGEKAIQKELNNYLILRISWVFSSYRSNFVKTMLSLKEKKDISIIFDQKGCPTSAKSVANIINLICNMTHRPKGVFHYTNKPNTTWFQFAEQIFFSAKKCNLVKETPILKKISSEQYKTIAKRPANSLLSTSKIEDALNIEIKFWKDELDHVLRELNGE